MDAHAWLFDGPGVPFRPATIPLPENVEPGYIVVELRMATICGSDVHTVLGHRQEPIPSILGHEGVGNVIMLGGGRSDILVGDRISWSIADSCGRCDACTRNELPQKCQQLFKYGHASVDNLPALSGCYASHILLRPGTAVVPIPEHLPDAVVAPANCALATMVCALEKRPRQCERVLIQGAGLLGLYGCALLHSVGVNRVYVSDINDDRLALVEQFGGIPVRATPPDPTGKQNVTHDSLTDLDLVVEAAGHSSLVPEGVSCLRAGGSYIFVGMVHPDSTLEVTGEQIIRKCLTVHGIHNYAPRHLARAIRFLADNVEKYPFTRLVSDPLPLDCLKEGFAAARRQEAWRVALVPSSARPT